MRTSVGCCRNELILTESWLVMTRTALILVLFLASSAQVQGDEPASAKAEGRVVEGTVVTTGRKPVEGAKVLFVQPEMGLWFVEGATATTDAKGQYRADLIKFPWSTKKVRALVLAPDFKACDRIIEPGLKSAKADFELLAAPWKEIQVRLEDTSGKPVAGVEVTCSLGAGGVVWSRSRTDEAGSCRISMEEEMGVGLTVSPKGARPIMVSLGGMKDVPASITLPVLPPIQGRVLDPAGRPVPDVAVGRLLAALEPNAKLVMYPLLGGVKAVTDRDGRFVITPMLMLRGSSFSRPKPDVPFVLCFADPTSQRIAVQFFDPNRASEPLEVTLAPARRVRIPIKWGSLAMPPKAAPNAQIMVLSRPDNPDSAQPLIVRGLPFKGQGEGTVIEEYLPAGTYQLEVNFSDPDTLEELGKVKHELVVPKGDGPLGLPPIEVEPVIFRKLAGKPAPEIEATDLNTGKPVKLADFRGKVVVLDFWGYWCGPCLGNMPHLMDLQRKFEGRPLVIVSLHDQSVQSRAEYDRKTAMARKHMWGGRELPFRVLLDRPDPAKPDDSVPEANGMTCKRYGIRGFPTILVIDKDGTMVGQVWFSQHDRLEKLVRDLLEKDKSR
jgi:thiol-disulfide isomerase/thioredoxin